MSKLKKLQRSLLKVLANCYLVFEMDSIYNRNGMFDYGEVLNEMSRIDEELEAERAKDDSEYSREKEFQLLYRQLMVGLKLNTGTKIS